MILLLLSGLVVLAVGGCVCVVWARRGGPRWVRVIAMATLTAGELVRRSGRGEQHLGPVVGDHGRRLGQPGVLGVLGSWAS